jgi:23S rRNA (pseudouridine1915-N3)-methyltransferase
MRVHVLAVGRMKSGAEAELAERYRKRAAQVGRNLGLRDIEIIEIKESRAPETAKRRIEESIALANVIPDGAVMVLLDEKGPSLGSGEIAQKIRAWRDGGTADLVFVLGGPDGIAPSLREKAVLTLAFGPATWPHQLARVMLLERIYRAITILSGHPYHRE